MVAQEIVERPPFGREVNAIADRHNLVITQLRGDDRSAQALLFLAPGVERVDLLHVEVCRRLSFTGIQRGFIHGVGTVAFFILFAAPARAWLISSDSHSGDNYVEDEGHPGVVRVAVSSDALLMLVETCTAQSLFGCGPAGSGLCV
jgi:hypothetical protein